MFATGWLVLLDLPIVNIAFQVAVSLKPIGYDGAAGLDRLADESVQRGPIGVGNVAQADTADGFAPPRHRLCSHNDQSLLYNGNASRKGDQAERLMLIEKGTTATGRICGCEQLCLPMERPIKDVDGGPI